jgi:cytochrome c peroxidase
MQRWLGAAVAVVTLVEGCGAANETEPAAVLTSSALPSSKKSPGTRDAVHNKHLEVAADPLGTTASFSSNAFDAGSSGAFFASLGTNGRTCNSCHRQDQGWTIAAAKVKELAGERPSDSLFAPVDGTDCPPTSPVQAVSATFSTLLVHYGLIRIQLPVPAGADFSVVDATNPHGCSIAPASAGVGGALFLFRRPLPTANLEFLSTVMWDGRETHQKLTQGPHFTNTGPLTFDLISQDDHANQGHEQAPASIIGTPVVGDLLGFETNLYTAQQTVGSLDLDLAGAHGGPKYLGNVAARAFFIGENDPLAPGFTTHVFTIFEKWEPDGSGRFRGHLTDQQKSIGRGEGIFNARTFTITNVAGLNSAKNDPLANPADPLFGKRFQGTCTTCHNSFDVGNHSTSLPLNIGVTLAHPTDNASGSIAGILDVASLPVYTLRSASGAIVQVTDPARALVSGRFVDAGKTKGPTLRALSSRAPYFHNGSAKDLATVVRFYDARFGIGLTDRDASDLVAFLGAL